jgi:hypothetical protein
MAHNQLIHKIIYDKMQQYCAINEDEPIGDYFMRVFEHCGNK